jgi:hypothetical protein
MGHIPSEVKSLFTASLLGRLKLKLYQKMTSREDFLPEDRSLTRYLFQRYRINAQSGVLFTHILSQTSAARLDYSKVEKGPDVGKLLSNLEKNPLKGSAFIEITNCPSPLPSILGACIHCQKLRDGSYVYFITLLDEHTFPDFCLSRVEILTGEEQSSLLSNVLTASGFEHFYVNDYQKSTFTLVALNALQNISETHGIRLMSVGKLKNLKTHPDLLPPRDNKLLALLVSTMRGKTECVQTKINLSMIQPFNLDFCFSYPVKEVKWAIGMIRKGSETPMLVYWNGSAFIMSDDYAHYLGYRSLDYKEVPIVIVGKFPKDIIGEYITGGPELIPPVTVTVTPDYGLLTPEMKNWMLDRVLQKKRSSEITSRLYGFFIWLALLLDNPHTKEKELHEFLQKHPMALDSYGSRVMSEVRLGSDYRIDLVIQYKLDDKRILLVELERASLPIFTESGRLRSHVTHAIQQVEDWLQWWHEHPNDIPRVLDDSIPPQGLVVIGRSEHLDEQAKRRLLHLNHNRRVKVLTYDDLLERIEGLIENLEALET